MKACSKCGEVKRAAEFHKRSANKDGRSGVCKVCKSKYDREQKLLALYDLPQEEYNRMYEEQQGRCVICDAKEDVLHVDHDHETGVVRGLICSRCNKGLGFFKDNPRSFFEAVVYLTNPPYIEYLKENNPEKYQKTLADKAPQS